MIVEQAFYGTTSSGHGLLKASPAVAELAPSLAWRMDLPGTAPPGVTWESYVSGFTYGDYYVIAKTLPDPKASRPGMVFSHALFLPLGETLELRDFREIFSRLTASPEAPTEVASLDFQPSDLGAMEPEYAGALADAWLDQRPAPLVFLGLDHLPEAAAFLWSRLWPDARRNFSFRLSFGPQDVDGAAPSLVGTPLAARVRWTGYKLVDPTSTSSKLPSPAASAFAGLLSGEGVLAFGRALDHRPTSAGDFTRLAEAWSYAQDDSAAVDPLLAAIRLVGLLSPSPNAGVAPKSNLIRRLARAVPTMSPSEMVKLATIDFTAFPDAATIDAGVSAWVGARVMSPAAQDASVVALAAHPKAQSGWANAVWGGVQVPKGREKAELADAAWVWLAARPEIASKLIGRLAKISGLLDALAERTPRQIEAKVGEAVEGVAAARSLWRLHGATAAAWRTAKDAIARQLGADPAQGLDGVRASALRATGRELVEIALANPVPSAIALAGEAAAAERTLLRTFDAGSEAWQSIWASALAIDTSAWQGPEQPVASSYALFDRLLGRQPVDAQLLEALGRTPLADVIAFAERERLWQVLPVPARSSFLAATAQSWLEEIAENPFGRTAPEDELAQAICEPWLIDRLEAVAPIDAVLAVYSAFPRLDSSRFLGWLAAMVGLTQTSGLSSAQAAQLGQLIADREWDHAANFLLERMVRDHRLDLRPAVVAAAALLGFVDRYLNGLLDHQTSGVAVKWQVLATVGADLYPDGPRDHALWSRAGGHDADLPFAFTGRDRWWELARRMQHGAMIIEPAALLARMRLDFPLNPAIAQLSREPEFAPRPDPWKRK